MELKWQKDSEDEEINDNLKEIIKSEILSKKT